MLNIDFGGNDENMSGLLLHTLEEYDRRRIKHKNLHLIIEPLFDIRIDCCKQIRFFDIGEIETSNDRSLE